MFEAGYILCKPNYRLSEELMQKMKQHPALFYSKKHKSWCARANQANVNSFQKLFSIWDAAEFLKIYQQIPKESKTALLHTDDRYKGKFTFKFYPLHAETLEFVKNIPHRNYHKVEKIWILPYSKEVIEKLLEFLKAHQYIIRNNIDPKKKFRKLNHKEKQAFLLEKVPETFKDTLLHYTII